MSASAPASTEKGLFEKHLETNLGIESRPVLTVMRRGSLALAVTRHGCSRFFAERTVTLAPAPAFCIVHQLGYLDRHSRFLGGRPSYSGAPRAGCVNVIDLRERPRYQLYGPFDALQYYVPRRALDEFAQEHGGSPITTLRWDREQRDPFVATLSSLLLAAIEEDRLANQLFVDHLALSLLAHFAQSYGGLRIRGPAAEGGLAPWQEKRAKEIMQERLASNLTIADVAAECRLTPSHFARAFKKSTGVAPHKYLLDLRIEEAKRLMLTTDLPLAATALMCGFGDQSYFTRIFSRSVGCSPGLWRRNNSTGEPFLKRA